jgi:hypothetical protein
MLSRNITIAVILSRKVVKAKNLRFFVAPLLRMTVMRGWFVVLNGWQYIAQLETKQYPVL